MTSDVEGRTIGSLKFSPALISNIAPPLHGSHSQRNYCFWLFLASFLTHFIGVPRLTAANPLHVTLNNFNFQGGYSVTGSFDFDPSLAVIGNTNSIQHGAITNSTVVLDGVPLAKSDDEYFFSQGLIGYTNPVNVLIIFLGSSNSFKIGGTDILYNLQIPLLQLPNGPGTYYTVDPNIISTRIEIPTNNAFLEYDYFLIGTASLVATASSSPLQVLTVNLSSAISGQPYSAMLAASGGSGTGYSWSLSAGTLPPGFALSAVGVLSSTGGPAALAASYTFTVQVTDSAKNTATRPVTLLVSPPATIYFNGNAILGTAQAVVGQQISLRVSLPAGAVPASGQPWSVDGSPIGGFAVSPSYQDPETGSVTALDFSKISTVFYWAVPGTFNATFSYALNGKSASAQATFDVVGPTGSFIATTLGMFNIGSCHGPLRHSVACLNFGLPPATPDDSPTNAGISFAASAQLPQNDPGTYQWVQQVTEDTVSLVVAGRSHEICQGQPGLDISYPYENFNPTSDSPAVSLESRASSESRAFGATMFLMWNPLLPSGCSPPTPGSAGNCTSLMIPLGSVSWRFLEVASRKTFLQPWALDHSSSTQSASQFVSFMEGDTFPGWQAIHSGSNMRCYSHSESEQK